MATNILLMSFSIGQNAAAGSTRYMAAMGESDDAGGEALAEVTMHPPSGNYTWDQGGILVVANATSATSTVVSRVNLASGNMSLSIGAGVTGLIEDLSNSDAVSDGDEIDWRIIVGAGGQIDWNLIRSNLTHSTDDAPIISSKTTRAESITTGQTRYISPVGGAPDNTRATISSKVFNSATLADMGLRINANTNTGGNDCVISFNDSGVNGSMVITVTPGTTGLVEDLVNTDAIVSGDDISIEVDNSAGDGTIQTQGVTIFCTSATGQWLGMSTDAGTIGASTTNYGGLSGEEALPWETTESKVRIDANIALDYTEFTWHSTFNSRSDTTTIDVRKNGVSTGLSISVGGGVTGTIHDTDTVAFAAGDDINFRAVTGAGTGLFRVLHLWIEAQQPAAVGGRIMGSLAGLGGLAGHGGLAGKGGGLAA